MVLSFLYLAFQALPGALVRSRRGLHVKDIELLVLRHELALLRRQVSQPKLRPADRALLAGAACHLPRPARSANAWSLRGRYCVGIERLCVGSGASLRDDVGGRSCRLRFGSWCYSSRARIRAGRGVHKFGRRLGGRCGTRPADVAIASVARPLEVVLELVARVRRRLPAVRAGRAARAPRALERAGDPCVTPRVVDPAPARRPAAVRAARPAAARRAQSDAAAPLVAGIPGAAGDALALASAACREPLEFPAPAAGPAAGRR